MFNFIVQFLKLESAGGIVLMGVAALAMMIANSPLADAYLTLFSAKPSIILINDGLMAIFFLMIGIEIKNEILEGQLSRRRQALLPLTAAIGGVLLPALIYSAFNAGTPQMRGWAIPSATDIAFSLGVLSLFGNRIAAPAKIFLMAVAVIDDLIAVMIIALFYTSDISFAALAGAISCAGALYAFNRYRITALWPYLGVGLAMWCLTLFSGVHATIAGVALGLLMPLAVGKPLVHALHPWVVFGIVPLFALANAGIPLAGIGMEQITNPLTMGIAIGLFVGKQVGIFAAAWLMIRKGWATLPERCSWLEFYAVCMIAGIGFTMSLFIGSLAFPGTEMQVYTRMGVMLGSFASAVIGALLLIKAVGGRKGHADDAL